MEVGSSDLTEFPLSQLESAVFQRDEDTVKQLLGRFCPQYVLTESDKCAFTSAIGWPHGLRIMLELYIPEILPHLLHEAIAVSQFESAEIILHVGQCRISEYSIAEAAYCYNPAFFKLLAKSLATQRRHLQQLANQRLSPNHLQELGVGDCESLLDAQSFRVEEALRESFGVSPSRWNTLPYKDGTGVYHLIDCNVDAAKALYSQEFTDVNQVNPRGLSPLSALRLRGSVDALLEMCEWLLDKGASLDSPALPGPFLRIPKHQIAYHIGKWLIDQLYNQGIIYMRTRCWEWKAAISELSTVWFSVAARHWTILEQIFTDTQHCDGCLCACSGNGCLPLSVLLRCTIHEPFFRSLSFVNSSKPGFISAALLDDQHPLAPPCSPTLTRLRRACCVPRMHV